MVEKVVNAPLVLPATDKRPELKFAQIGPMELGEIKQRIRRNRLKMVLDVAPDNRAVIHEAIHGTVTDEELNEFISSPEGIVFLLYLAAKKAGMDIEESLFHSVDLSEPIWAETLQWILGLSDGQQA